MRAARVFVPVLFTVAVAACGEALPSPSDGSDAPSTADAIDARGDSIASDAPADVSIDEPMSADTGGPDVHADVAPADAGPVTAAELLALTSACVRIAGSPLYSTDTGTAATIPLCQLQDAIYWQADMDIDCDGGQGAVCMSDPWYLPDTSAVTSSGQPLDASTLPFIVIPSPRTGFRYADHGIALGSVGAVIYRGRVVYGIFGDAGPSAIIGEASYAMAMALGINSDPATGGVDTGVTYIVFTGPSGEVTRNEDHAEAVRVGEARASLLARGI